MKKQVTSVVTQFGRLLVLVFFAMFVLGTKAVAQNNDARITLSCSNEPMPQVLKKVEKLSNYKVLFTYDEIASYMVSINVKDASVSETLSGIIGNYPLKYTIRGSYITISAKNVTYDGRIINGFVKDVEGEPLPGVSVAIKGTSTIATTDFDGFFSVKVPRSNPNAVLVFDFAGMRSREIRAADINTSEPVKVILDYSKENLEEIVVTGYQSLRKRDVVGSVATVKAADIMMPAYSSIDQMLQGRVAGMMVMNTSSRVGTNPKIRIRGTSTILGNQDPLWVVDGVIQPDPIPINQNDLMVDDLKNILGNQISWLNPADIETITVLKDASATAIYGSKAANGVIVITTKRGQTDRTHVNYSGTFSVQARPHYGMFNLMNSNERIVFSQEAFAAGAVYQEAPIPTMNTYEGIMSLLYNRQISIGEAEAAINSLQRTNTDWLKILTRNSFSHNHNLSISGGSEKVIYNASLGYNDQQGIEIDNAAKNLSGRINLGIKIHPKLHLDMNLVGSVNRTRGYAANVNPLDYATTTSRSVLAYDKNGNRYFQDKLAHYPLNSNTVTLGYNILNEIDNSYSKNKASQINGNLNLSWDILPCLRYEFVGGINNNSGSFESYAGEQTFYVAQAYRGYDFGTESYGSDRYKAAMLPLGGELYNGISDVFSWNIQNKVIFQKTFNEHHRLNILLGTEASSAKTSNKYQKIFGYVPERGEKVMKPTPINEIVPIGEIPVYGWGILEDLYNGSGWSRTTLKDNKFSVFANLAYSFKDKYVVNASMRNDASNRFGQDQNKRFDPTYSFGVSWDVMREPWMSRISSVLNQFNLRASYGVQGNAVNSISPELILSMGSTKPYYGDYMSLISRIPNPNLSWERTKTWNFGVDIQLINWITMNLEYYTKSSNNIVNQHIALEYGRVGTEINGGRILNSGVEYTLNITPIRTKDWGWTIGLNSSKNWNKAKTMSVSEIALRDYLNGSHDKVLKKGYAVSSFWSYDFKGLNKEDGSPEFNRLFKEDENGNFIKDEKGNLQLRGVADYSDMLVYSGKTEPDFTGGLTTRLRWKGLTFGANFSLLIGAKKRLANPYPASGYIPLSNINLSKDLINRWKEPGDEVNTNIPGVYTGRITNVMQLQDGRSYNAYDMWGESSYLVVNSDFLRCQQMSLTWNVSNDWCARMKVRSISVNAIVNNVFVIASKRFQGFDPELGNSVRPKTYSLGITIGL